MLINDSLVLLMWLLSFMDMIHYCNADENHFFCCSKILIFFTFFLQWVLFLFSGLATGFYATNSPDACSYIAENACCNIIVVENDHQLQKILSIKEKLPHLKAIIQYKGQPKSNNSQVYSVSLFENSNICLEHFCFNCVNFCIQPYVSLLDFLSDILLFW